MEIAGRVLTDYFLKFLNENIQNFAWFAGKNRLEIAHDLKEKLCYVAQNYEQENN